MKKLLLCFLALCLFTTAKLQAKESPGSSPDLDAEWKRLMLETTYDQAIDFYAPVFEVERDIDVAVDKDKCVKHYPELKAGVIALPVSAALSYWSYRCAEVAGTEAEAEKYLALFSRIAKYSFDQASEQAVAKPIRVINQTDMFALVAASGLKLQEQYINTSDFGRYMPWVIVLWDEKDQRERSYTFDLLEFVSAASDKKLGSTRAYRLGTARGLVRSYAKAEWAVAQDALVSMESLSENTVEAQMEKLKPQVLQNGMASSTRMFVHCIETSNQVCGKTVIDGMLEALEAKQTSAMVRMAALYSAGIGVKQDADASIDLLKAAEKRTGNKGLALYDFMYLQFDKDQIGKMPVKVMSYLESESFVSGKGKAAPAFVYMQMRKLGNEQALKQYGDKLQPVAEAGVEDSYELYAAHVASKKPASDYPRWLEKAARAGHAHSQQLLALDMQKSKEKIKQEQAENWLLESARNGNLQAMKSIADGLYDEKRWEEAAVWYESAANDGDVDSSLQLASIYAMTPKGTDYTEQDAVDIYKSLSENNDSAAARREWSDLLVFGKTLKHDLVKAQQLLQQDADKNDPASMVALGSRLLNGEFGAKDEKAGMAWLKKADASGNLMATNAIATYLYYLKGDAESLKDAKMYWGKAALRKYMPAVNNFAWALCTSSYSGFLDAGLGLDLFKMSADTERLAPSHRDTYAACLAANGDFKSAIVHQQMVIEEMKKRGFENDSSMSDMNQRLALYRKNLTYLEPAKSKAP